MGLPEPPRGLHDVGPGDFALVGERFLGFFKDAGLEPTHDVLDMGCGIGRIAVPLTTYLRDGTRYAGFDIDRNGIEWCQEHVVPLHPSFSFFHVDLYNKAYNAEAKTPATEFRFPYEDRSFDFVLATSLFTHLLPDDAWHYLAEAVRVLRPGGRLFITYFLLNDEVRERRDKWKETLHFRHDHGGCWVNSVTVPEAVVAYDDAAVTKAYADHRLTIDDIWRGRWSGFEGRTHQDVVLARRES